jgi:hypothetical protein
LCAPSIDHHKTEATLVYSGNIYDTSVIFKHIDRLQNTDIRDGNSAAGSDGPHLRTRFVVLRRIVLEGADLALQGFHFEAQLVDLMGKVVGGVMGIGRGV